MEQAFSYEATGHGGAESAPPTVPPTRRSRYDLRKRDSGGSLGSRAPGKLTVVRSPLHRTVPSNRRDRSNRPAARWCGVRTTVEGARENSVVVSHHHRTHHQRSRRIGGPVHPGLSRGRGGRGDAHTSTVRRIGAVVKRRIPCPARDSATSSDSPRQPWTTNDNQQPDPRCRRLSMRPRSHWRSIRRFRRQASIEFRL